LFGDLYSGIPQPKDKGIILKDILESEVDEKYYISDKVIQRIATNQQSQFISTTGKSPAQRSSTGRSLDSKHNYQIINIDGELKSNQDKAACFTAGAHSGGNHSDMDLVCIEQRSHGFNKGGLHFDKSPTVQASHDWAGNNVVCVRFGRSEEGKRIRKEHKGKDYTPFQAKEIVGFNTEKMNTVTCATTKDNLIMQINPSIESGGKQPYQQNRIYDENGIMPAVMTENRGNVLTQSRIRRLTPTEVSRLQTIPDWYVWKCSDTQIYRMCGNGWTVEVIKHILSFI